VRFDRVVPSPAGGGIAHGQKEVDGLVVARQEATVTAKGVANELLKPGSTRIMVEEDRREFKRAQDNVFAPSPCRTCSLSTWQSNEECDDIHAI
jgi:hypothetical protein